MGSSTVPNRDAPNRRATMPSPRSVMAARPSTVSRTGMLVKSGKTIASGTRRRVIASATAKRAAGRRAEVDTAGNYPGCGSTTPSARSAGSSAPVRQFVDRLGGDRAVRRRRLGEFVEPFAEQPRIGDGARPGAGGLPGDFGLPGEHRDSAGDFIVRRRLPAEPLELVEHGLARLLEAFRRHGDVGGDRAGAGALPRRGHHGVRQRALAAERLEQPPAESAGDGRPDFGGDSVPDRRARGRERSSPAQPVPGRAPRRAYAGCARRRAAAAPARRSIAARRPRRPQAARARRHRGRDRPPRSTVDGPDASMRSCQRAQRLDVERRQGFGGAERRRTVAAIVEGGAEGQLERIAHHVVGNGPRVGA